MRAMSEEDGVLAKAKSRLLRFAFRAPIGLYRVGLGGLLARRFLLLDHIGRRSGETRHAVLEVLEADDDGPVIASGFSETSQWYRNVTANPDVFYTTRRTRIPATARRLPHPEAVAAFERYAVNHRRAARALGDRLNLPIADDGEAAATQIPLFRLVGRTSQGSDTTP